MKLHYLIHDLRSKVSSHLSKNLISNLLDLSWNICPAYRPLKKLLDQEKRKPPRHRPRRSYGETQQRTPPMQILSSMITVLTETVCIQLQYRENSDGPVRESSALRPYLIYAGSELRRGFLFRSSSVIGNQQW